MKKFIAMLLSLVMVLGLFAGCGAKEEAPATEAPKAEAPAAPEAPAAEPTYMEKLIADAQAEGTLVVYGSCEEEYLAVACEKFQELYGIEVQYQRLSTGEVQSKVEEEAGNPSGDVWFGGTTDPYNVCAAEGLLMAYEAENASHLLGEAYRAKTVTGTAFIRAFWASWLTLTNWIAWVWPSPLTGPI